MKKRTTTKSVKNIEITTGIDVYRLYPRECFRKDNGEAYKTRGIQLTREQAIELATDILIGAKEWEIINITGFIGNKDTVTVTGRKKVIVEE